MYLGKRIVGEGERRKRREVVNIQCVINLLFIHLIVVLKQVNNVQYMTFGGSVSFKTTALESTVFLY